MRACSTTTNPRAWPTRHHPSRLWKVTRVFSVVLEGHQRLTRLVRPSPGWKSSCPASQRRFPDPGSSSARPARSHTLNLPPVGTAASVCPSLQSSPKPQVLEGGLICPGAGTHNCPWEKPAVPGGRRPHANPNGNGQPRRTFSAAARSFYPNRNRRLDRVIPHRVGKVWENMLGARWEEGVAAPHCSAPPCCGHYPPARISWLRRNNFLGPQCVG